MSKNNDSDIRVILAAKLFIPLVAVLTILVLLLKDCADDTDPIDNSWKDVEHLRNVYVADSLGNGFRLAYVTSHAVTKERAREILTRQPLLDSWARLEKDAPVHFGPMLYTDIYNFACFARQYDVDSDVQIHCIFVIGAKCKLYVGPNPKLPDSATYFNYDTEQGALWINHTDVYHCDSPNRLYRYWKCSYPFEYSKTDEHFSHFSEEKRIR